MNNILLPIQAILMIFVLFAVSRAFLRLKDGSLSFGAFLFWSLVWLAAGTIIINPYWTTYIAKQIGIQRGTDVVIYLSIALLFYLIFRTNILIENLREEITKLTRIITLKNAQKNKKE